MLVSPLPPPGHITDLHNWVTSTFRSRRPSSPSQSSTWTLAEVALLAILTYYCRPGLHCTVLKSTPVTVFLARYNSRRPAMVEILARCGTSSRCQSLPGRSAMLLSSSRTTGLSGDLTLMPTRFICGTSCSIPQPDTGLNTILCRHW